MLTSTLSAGVELSETLLSSASLLNRSDDNNHTVFKTQSTIILSFCTASPKMAAIVNMNRSRGPEIETYSRTHFYEFPEK